MLALDNAYMEAFKKAAADQDVPWQDVQAVLDEMATDPLRPITSSLGVIAEAKRRGRATARD